MQQNSIDVMEDTVAFLRDKVTAIDNAGADLAKRVHSLDDAAASTHAKLLQLRATVDSRDSDYHSTFQGLALGQQQLKGALADHQQALAKHQDVTANSVAELQWKTGDVTSRVDTHDRRLDVVDADVAGVSTRQQDAAHVVASLDTRLDMLANQHVKAQNLHLKLDAAVSGMDKELRRRLDDAEKAFDGLNLDLGEVQWAQGETNKMVEVECKELARSVHAVHGEMRDVASNLPKFHELKKMLDGLQHVELNDSEAVDKQLNALALSIAQIDLKQEHFRSHSTSFPEDLKNDLSGLLLRAGRLISGSIRCQLHFKLLTDDGANVDEAAILHGLRMAAAASFAKKVHQLVDKLSPPTDAKYSVQARDIFERRLRVCLECRFKDGTPNQHDNHDLGPKKGLKTNPIDTRTVIPRRSGHTNVPQKANAEPIHVHPHTKEKFVYRGGFRLPKNGSKPSTDGIEAPVDLNDHPCLEKVALVGTFQVRDEYGV
ncbi:hypothetical protein B5M09_005047 [Aphanomyces astaci]|uniref:Uncharacterized protein n=1 Tax=Aphanomyces astaci TaxID=112090 RepID=A0A425D1B4_APHAT|nr:hypothetical protein B5M09_005047 [Aphanomyces astaci]